MDRRSVLRAVGVVSFLPLGTMCIHHAKAEAVAVAGRRISTVKGDAGELFYAKLCGDGKVATVFLDDVEQKWCITADEAQGIVVRHIETEQGNIAINMATEILQETVKGRVRIAIV